MSNAKLPFPKDKSSNNKNNFFIHKLYHENGITYICMQELCAPALAPSILFLFCDEKKKNTGQEKETR